ncbi:multidrug efflux MFS transporter [Streptococcus oralis]|uniref:MFS transporter n=1 Tax=Streptococcus oralis subsp. tigurinus TaxID=1077464 RepID=A0AAX0N401_STROR|nr:multidrug efflux MFS transporter [Streptococcus oralis]EIC78021.1 transporter, major facilitator family protein [Streptococcus oralis SK100]KZX06264.1 50S ribosomal protein L33 [Streptococcus oralis]MBS3687986.1 multidrug efflux MFS transporter [Streptococcus oralis]MCY7083247.1 multidrug efflux MFS transporter [Streptococcus oralis]MCY7106188.1 multidrug efflux MFS transporter [Streptococcus oralis]
MQEISWKENLRVAWFGSFLTGASISLVVPFMPIFVEQLGIEGDQVAFYAGLAISVSAVSAALVSPIWGILADKYGRKPMMIRAGLAMTITMGGLAFVPNIYWLLFLRLLNGVFTGFVPNATALIASQVPKDKSGAALGTLSTGVVAGTLTGPFVGGLVAEIFGIRNVFLLVGTFLFLAAILTIFFIKEDFQPVAKEKAIPTKEVFSSFKYPRLLANLFLTSFVIQFSAQSIGPILALYVRDLGQSENLLFVSGLIVSSMGFSSMMSAGILGKLGDKVGNHRLLVAAQIYSVIIYLLCAHATSPLQLGLYRFLFGLGTGALIPGVNALLSKMTPKSGISRIFAFNQVFFYLGGVIGPMAGSAVAGYLGYHAVFYATAACVAFSCLCNIVQFRSLLKVKEI